MKIIFIDLITSTFFKYICIQRVMELKHVLDSKPNRTTILWIWPRAMLGAFLIFTKSIMENFNFEYNFSLLSASIVRARGIKSLLELKEVFEDDDSQFEVLREDKYPILAVIGFTAKSLPLKIAFSNIEGTITFLDVRIASKKEVIEEFCKYCK